MLELQDAQFGNMKGEILNASIKCFAASLQVKLADVDASNVDSTSNDSEHHGLHRSFDDFVAGVQWKRICDELKIVPSRQVVFSKAPWSFCHVLDGTSPLLKPAVRKRINELGCWPADLNDHEKIRGCLAPEVKALVSLSSV
jgi:fructose-1,6-bisphosphatase/sedoheptulose 1,7-bisphosphatase-like protein